MEEKQIVGNFIASI